MFASLISVPGAPEPWTGTRLGLVWLGVYSPDLPFLPESSVTFVCYVSELAPPHHDTHTHTPASGTSAWDPNIGDIC